jgi:hypothetical protein
MKAAGHVAAPPDRGDRTMHSFRYLLLPALLFLTAGCTRGAPEKPARNGGDRQTVSDRAQPDEKASLPPGPSGEDRVLVPGGAALTLHTVQLYQQMWQWYCGLRLSPQQQRRHQDLFVVFWKKQKPAERQRLLAAYKTMNKNWRDILEMKKTDRERERLRVRDSWMTNIGKNREEISLYMVEVYEAAWKPGSPNNPILVASEPPLTRVVMDQRLMFVEWLLDLSLSDSQRRDYQRLFIKGWNSADRAKKADMVKNIQEWGKLLPQQSGYGRNVRRALVRPAMVAVWEKSPYPGDRWLLELYRSAYKVGGKRNPVLVKGEPVLTQAMVDSYGDYLEWTIDLSISGGLSEAQREVLRDYLVKDWKKMTREQRQEFQGTLDQWTRVTRADPRKRNELHGALQPKLLAELRTSREPRNVWLLEIHNKDRAEFKRRMEMEKQRHEMVMRIIDSMRPTGRWEYNPVTRRHDRWVPYR